jgi:universal stress protein E
MDKLTSILVVIDPADETRHVLAKAMVLARHFGARLELFLCDSENAYALSHAYDATGVAAARRACLSCGHRYLDAVRRSLAEDVQVTAHVACESPLYEAIVHRVLATRPDLVLKSAAGHHVHGRYSLDANDWQLARTCPAPLMLTRGQHWRAIPRFAAAVDVAQTDGTSLARSIMQTAGFLARVCRGELEVLFSSPLEEGPGAHAARVACLGKLVKELRIGSERTNVLQGRAEETLPAFAAERNYDVLVMGALTHRRGGPAALLGTLTSKLVDALDCDFVLVKPEPYACPVVARQTASA